MPNTLALLALRDSGAMPDAIARHDWASSAIGTRDRWPEPLRTLVAVMLISPQPMFITWGAARTLIYNDAYARLLGRKHPDALGRPFLEVWPEIADDLAPLYERVDAGLATQMDDITLFLDRHDGPEETHFAFSYNPVLSDRAAVVGMLCICTETTARVLAERRVAAQNERLRLMFDQAPGFICILRGPDHVFEIVNRAYSRLIGGRAVLGFRVADVLPEAAAQGFVDLLDRVWRTGEAITGRQAPFAVAGGPGQPDEIRYCDFVYQPLLDDGGRVTGIFVEGSDVTEARRAEAARRENDAWIRGIGDTMPGFLWSADRRGKLTQTSGPWTEYSSRVAGDTLGDGWLDFVHAEDKARVIAEWADCVESGRFYSIEFRILRADGAYHWTLVRAAPIRDTDGVIGGWAGLNVDIDDQKRAEAALQALNETLEQRVDWAIAERERAEDALRQAQKMEAIGQLTGGIAHDFNNMLQGVIGSLELMGRRVTQGRIAEVAPLIDLASQGADRAATLTRRLLGFARRQLLHDRAVDPNALVAGMAELVERTVGPGVTVRVELGRVGWPVLCDANQLESAILNLAINARDAMPDGGVLTLSTAERHLDPSRPGEAETLAAGDYAEIAVGDTGTGMTPEIAARAFEPFFTTKPIGQGTGLGLSQLYGFVRQSGGTVRLETTPGTGTVVRLFLPRDVAAHERPRPRRRGPERRRRSRAAASCWSRTSRRSACPRGRGAGRDRLRRHRSRRRAVGVARARRRHRDRRAGDRCRPARRHERPPAGRRRAGAAAPGCRCCSSPATRRPRCPTDNCRPACR